MTNSSTKLRIFQYWHYGLIISISLLLTVIAWKISDNQLQLKRTELFDFQAEKLLDRVSERMNNYEAALKAGASAVQSLSKNTQYEDWSKFAETLKLPLIYPGINGIGVIYKIQNNKIENFVEKQRINRQDFKIHPQHNEDEYWPITYIEPISTNQQAVGLDIAFEKNRLTAAKKARDTASTQITKPIILVQDKKKTPGFLQYIPFYDNSNIETIEQRKKHFVGHVYAPFIMEKLIEGTLRQSKRQLLFSISDSGDTLYDELKPSNTYYNDSPLYKKTVILNMYGRPWTFNIQTTQPFDKASNSNQPLIVLGAGITINIILLLLCITLARSQQKSITIAQQINHISVKEAYYRHIIESAPCGIIITNEKGLIEKVNPQTELLFGYDKVDMVGKSIDSLVPERFRMHHPEHRNNFNKSPSNRTMGLGRDIFGLRQDGTEFPAEIGLAQFSISGVSNTLVTIIDMADHVKITKELKRSNKELNDFAYVASHDLKAPLRGIMQLSSWIKEDIIDLANDETIQNLDLLINRTSRLENLLDDLLDYSRIGRKIGDVKTINIRKFVLDIFELQDPPKDVTIICEENIAEISTHIIPLEIIFRNLIGNAIKHKNNTALNITVTVKELPKHYQFSILDNGPGIPEKYHEQIFQLFKTLKPRDEVEGSGMGLSIIKKILDYKGGEIIVESDGEHGTCFIVNWPK